MSSSCILATTAAFATFAAYFLYNVPARQGQVSLDAVAESAVFKCLPIITLLIGSYYCSLPQIRHKQMLAVAFSLIGDFLLVDIDTYLLPGALSFGVAHVLYLMCIFNKHHTPITMHNIRQFLNTKAAMPVLIIDLLLLVTVLWRLYFKDTVLFFVIIVYALILTLMVTVAISAWMRFKTQSSLHCMIGFALFMASDCILIVDLFFPFGFGRLSNMTTYYGAQYFLFLSSTRRD